MGNVSVAVEVLSHGEGLDLPSYATEGSAGADLRAAVSSPVVIGPGERALVPTGVAIGVPAGYEAQVRMRSGLALKTGLYLPNGPGTIDCDYRGEVKVILANGGRDPVTISRGDRIAQLVVAPVARAVFAAVEELPATGRGPGGFGSTGT
jgi:dUTP pyrophosphatase